ncbi:MULTISPECIES: hypothetical protein [Sphingomonadaceae]|nr:MULTISPECIES: hypothetical protein [Sphingomonadaceae]
MLSLVQFMCFFMRHRASTVAALMLAIGAASPIAAQSADQKAPQPRMVYVPGRGTVLVQPVPTDDPRAVARTVIVPGYGEVYAVPVRPKDTRSPRPRCVDEEVAAVGGSPSSLAMSAIDLKRSNAKRSSTALPVGAAHAIKSPMTDSATLFCADYWRSL